MTADKPTVETLLGEHEFRSTHPAPGLRIDWRCKCGVRGNDAAGDFASHRAHVAQVIRDHHAGELASAWDECLTYIVQHAQVGSAGIGDDVLAHNPYRKDER